MTDQSRRHATDALKIGWPSVRQTLIAAVIGFGGWQAAQTDWPGAGRAMDQILWSHALKDRATVPALGDAAPIWRERTGASGDRIVERVHKSVAGQSALAVLDGISGKAIPAPVLAEQAAAQMPDADLPLNPASFDGLSAGDRLTITTTDGDVFSFEVVTHDDVSADRGVGMRVAVPDDSAGVVLYAIRPIESETPAALNPQHEL